MIDFIFKNWQKKLSDFESSVKKDLAEIRKCKAEIQQMRQDTEFERIRNSKGRKAVISEMTSDSFSRLRRSSSAMLTRQAYISTVQALR